MKRFMAIMLSVMLICTCIAPVAFADGVVSSTKVPVAFEELSFHGVGMSYEYGMFGMESSEQNYRVNFSAASGNKNQKVPMANDRKFTMSDGDRVKISTKFAVDAPVTTSKHLAMGPLNANEDNTRLIFGPYSGGLNSFSAGPSCPPENGYTKIASPIKTWVTYDFVYDMVESDGTVYIDKCSLYIDGEPSFVEYDFRNNDGSLFEASEIRGIYYGERGQKKDVHMADMSVTYYPEGCTEAVVLENPWEASGLGQYFKENTTDHTLLLINPSLTDEQIAAAAPTGWTFSKVSYDDAADGKIDYIKMVNGDTSYYKRIIVQDYVEIRNVTFTDARISTNTIYGGGGDSTYGTRYSGVTTKSDGTLIPEISTTSPKSENNQYVKMSYPKLPENQNWICGLVHTDAPGTSSPYINGALSGRVAYEWSFMVDEFATKSVACKMHINGTPGEKRVSDSEKWVPFQITDGVLRLDNTVTEISNPQTVLPGEWHHFVIITDTADGTIDIYQNGVLIGRRQFTQDDEYPLNCINGMEVGFNTDDGTGVNVPHAINFDDFRIGYVAKDWTPETASVTSSAEGVTVNNDTSVILGNLTATSDVTLSEGAVAVLSDGTLTVTDASGLVVRYYKICENEFSLTGFDLDGLTTEAGEKSKTITIENNKAEPYSAVLILAAYSNDGALVSVDVSPSATVYTKQTKQLTASVTVTEDEPAAKFKAFLWENTDSAYPLLENLGK